jgi:hypothetical protein
MKLGMPQTEMLKDVENDLRELKVKRWWLKANYSVTCRPVAGQRLGKHIPATTNTQATTGQLPLLCNALYIRQ